MGYVSNRRVWMGGDSAAASGDWELRIRADAKVFKNGPFLMGFTTSFRMGQLLQYQFVPPRQEDGVSDGSYMNTVFVDAVRKTLKDGGFAKVQNGVEEGGVFLIGFNGGLYKMEADFQIARSASPFEACGCGAAVAMGSMETSLRLNRSAKPERHLTMALEAAEKYSAGVRGPFVILESGK